LAVVLLLVLMKKDLRESLWSITKTATSRKISVPLLLMALWVTVEVLVMKRMSWWEPKMVTSTVFWSCGSGAVMFINATQVSHQEHFFRKSALSAFKVSVLLGVVMNLIVLNLLAELLLQPALFFLGALSAYAALNDEYRQAKILVNVLLLTVLVALVVYEVASIVNDPAVLREAGLVAELALPVWLMLGLLPFIYLVGTYSEYELAFLSAEQYAGRRVGKRLALVATFGLKLHGLHAFIATSAYRLSEVSSFAESRRAIRAAREEEDEETDPAE
jgi:hypothetical protein